MREWIWSIISILFTIWITVSFAIVVGHFFFEFIDWLKGVWA